ncbi:MAG: prepilin peptidase [Sphingomonadales bacterium]
MSGVMAEILVGIVAVMVLAAAVWDMRTRTIPNSLNAAIALLAIPYWWASGIALWPDVAIQLAMGAGLFALFAAAFAIGAMGGGDVKLIAALALWLRPDAVLAMLVIMSLAGGALTLVMLARHRLTKAKHQLEIPYGVAIAVGGIWLIAERFLNQFA